MSFFLGVMVQACALLSPAMGSREILKFPGEMVDSSRWVVLAGLFSIRFCTLSMFDRDVGAIFQQAV